jgi:hypothetical protein
MAPAERFEGEEEVVRAPVNPDELRLVLHDLTCDVVEEERATKELPNDHVTAEAIAETLDIPLDDVYAAIARVRRNDVREHVAKVLSELEEPTHRVERPGPSTKDPLISHYGFRRESVFNSVLDKLPKPGGQKKTEEKKEEGPTKEEREADKRAIRFIAIAGAVAVASYWLIQLIQALR